MIRRLFGAITGNPWVTAGIVLGVLALIGAAAGAIAWLRADAYADGKAACEAEFTQMIDQVAYAEAIRRAEAAEAALRASIVLRERDEAEISDLTRKVDRYALERKNAGNSCCLYELGPDYCSLLELRGEDRPECRGADRGEEAAADPENPE